MERDRPPVNAIGRLVGIARRPKYRAPMELLERGTITEAAGLQGDYRGAKYPRRQVTVLAIEDWQAALVVLTERFAAAGAGPKPFDLDWTERRANLLVQGLLLPAGRGSLLRIADVRLEVTGETTPCARMDEVALGLRRALASGRFGGVTCRVLTGGDIALGDPVVVERALQNRLPLLPG